MEGPENAVPPWIMQDRNCSAYMNNIPQSAELTRKCQITFDLWQRRISGREHRGGAYHILWRHQNCSHMQSPPSIR